LHTLGQIAGTLLLLELMLALALVLAIAGGLAFVAYWTHKHVVPVVGEYSARAKQVVDVGARAGDRVVEGVAEFHGRRMGLETALRVFFLGPDAARGLVRRAPAATPAPSPALDAIARPVTTDATTDAPQTTRIRFPQPPPVPATPPTGDSRADRRPPRIAPAPTMALHETPPIRGPLGERPAPDPSPISHANVLHRAAPLAPLSPLRSIVPTSPIGRAGTAGGMRAGMANGAGFLGF